MIFHCKTVQSFHLLQKIIILALTSRDILVAHLLVFWELYVEISFHSFLLECGPSTWFLLSSFLLIFQDTGLWEGVMFYIVNLAAFSSLSPFTLVLLSPRCLCLGVRYKPLQPSGFLTRPQ